MQKKERNLFDQKKLQKIVDNLPEEYELRMIDKVLYHKCKETQWSKDLVSQYDIYGTYEKLGLGLAEKLVYHFEKEYIVYEVEFISKRE